MAAEQLDNLAFLEADHNTQAVSNEGSLGDMQRRRPVVGDLKGRQ